MKKQLFIIVSLLAFVLSLTGCKSALTSSTYQTESEVKKITLEDSACNLNIIKSEDKELKVEYFEKKETYTYTITMNNQTGSLVMKRKDSRKGFIKESFTTTPSTTIYVPEEFEIDLDININAGNIKIEDVNTKDVKVKLNAGSTEITRVKSSSKFEVEHTAGSVTLKNLEMKEFSYDLHSGDYDIKNSTFSDSMKIKGYASNVELSGIDSPDMNVEVTTGKVEYLSANITGALSILVTTGDINVSLNGKKSDYTVTKKTGVGEDETIGNGSLIVNLKTTVGVISVDYLK